MAKDLNFKVSPIGAQDLFAFQKLPQVRRDRIAAMPAKRYPEMPPVNRMAARLHPRSQKLTIYSVTQLPGGMRAYRMKGESAAYFRAGQCVYVRFEVNGVRVNRPYSLSSDPADALKGEYEITVKTGGGFVSDWVSENWKEGMEVEMSGPEGQFFYDPIRDGKQMCAVAGGVGITPFLSMIRSLGKGTLNPERFTLLYGANTTAELAFKEELDEIADKNPAFQVVYVIAKENASGMKKGFITGDLIREIVQPAETTFFVCGPSAMLEFMKKEFEKMEIHKRVRFDAQGAIKDVESCPGYPGGTAGKVFSIKVRQGTLTADIPAAAGESIIVALERANLAPPSGCRSGICAVCRTRLISGEVFIPEDRDGRRAADRTYGFIHPCVTYALGNLELELPR